MSGVLETKKAPPSNQSGTPANNAATRGPSNLRGMSYDAQNAALMPSENLGAGSDRYNDMNHHHAHMAGLVGNAPVGASPPPGGGGSPGIFSQFMRALTQFGEDLKGNATQDAGTFIWGEASSSENSTATKAGKGATVKGTFDFAAFMEIMNAAMHSAPKNKVLKERLKEFQEARDSKDASVRAGFLLTLPGKIAEIKSAIEEEDRKEREGKGAGNPKATTTPTAATPAAPVTVKGPPEPTPKTGGQVAGKAPGKPVGETPLGMPATWGGAKKAKTGGTAPATTTTPAPKAASAPKAAKGKAPKVKQWVYYDLSQNMYSRYKHSDGTYSYQFSCMSKSEEMENPKLPESEWKLVKTWAAP